MYPGIEQVELGLAVSLGRLSAVMQQVSAGGTRWWTACDPRHGVEKGSVTFGFGYPGCIDPFNASFYSVPVLNEALPRGGVDDLVLLWDSNVIRFECGDADPGTFCAFFIPIKNALATCLQAA